MNCNLGSFLLLSSDVTVFDDTTEQQLPERIQGVDILVTKEMPLRVEMVQRLFSILADNIKKFMEGNPIHVVAKP